MSKIIKKCYICTVEWVYFLNHSEVKYAQSNTQLRFWLRNIELEFYTQLNYC